MKVYIAESDGIYPEIEEKNDIVSSLDESDVVFIPPGGLSAIFDLSQALKLGKKTVLFNKNMYYKDLINHLYKAHLEGDIKNPPSGYLIIESDIHEVNKRLEEIKNDKINDGKTSKLL